MFFTPDASNSPVSVGFEERHTAPVEPSQEMAEQVHEIELENERLPSPPVQVISA